MGLIISVSKEQTLILVKISNHFSKLISFFSKYHFSPTVSLKDYAHPCLFFQINMHFLSVTLFLSLPETNLITKSDYFVSKISQACLKNIDLHPKLLGILIFPKYKKMWY